MLIQFFNKYIYISYNKNTLDNLKKKHLSVINVKEIFFLYNERREKIKSQFLNLWIRYNIRTSAAVVLHNNLTKKKKRKNTYFSIFWWTNETVNIWSHIFGWMLFFGLTLYDLCLLNIHAPFGDKMIVALLLVCFQVIFNDMMLSIENHE